MVVPPWACNAHIHVSAVSSRPSSSLASTSNHANDVVFYPFAWYLYVRIRAQLNCKRQANDFLKIRNRWQKPWPGFCHFISVGWMAMCAGICGYHVLTTLQWEPLSVANLICKECILPRYIVRSDWRYMLPHHFLVLRILLYVHYPLVSWLVHGTPGSKLGTQRDTTGEQVYLSSKGLSLGYCVPCC